MLTNTSGEDNEVYSVHSGYIRADVLDNIVGELLEYELGLRVSSVGQFVQFAGIRSFGGKTQETGFAVEDGGHLVRVYTQFLLQVQHGVGVNITHAGTHNHTLQRGEAHGSVYALAVLDGADGTAGAQVAGDDLGVVNIQACELGAHTGHELVGGAVSTVTANAVFLIILVRQTVHVGVGRHGLVESGVEGNYLRNAGKSVLHGVDTQQVGRVVERGKICAEGNLVQHVLVHQHGAGEEVSTLHNAVTHGLNVFQRLEHTRLRVCEGLEDELHALFVIRDGNVQNYLILSSGSILENAGRKADFLCNTLCNYIKNVVAFHVQKLVLDGRASAVDYENDHIA